MDAMSMSEDRRARSGQGRQSSQVVGSYYWKNPVRIAEVPSLLLEERIIFMPPYINEAAVHEIVGILLHLESQDVNKDIQLYIDCYGSSTNGHLYEGLAIYDT